MGKYYEGPINPSHDWGAIKDPEDGKVKPASGNAVQTYIKQQFKTKAGCFYLDPTNNRYIVFADAESRDMYLANPALTHLIIATFDAPFNYTASINLLTAQYNAIGDGSTGNYIKFTFDTVNKSGQSMNEPVNCTITILHEGIKKTINNIYQPGTTVSFLLDQYLKKGTNTISIGVIGVNTLAATTIGVVYEVVSLSLDTTFDISKAITYGSNVVEFPIHTIGNGSKILKWFLDGEELPYNQVEDEVLNTESSRVKTIPLNGLAPGVHSIQVYATIQVGTSSFKSHTIYRSILLVDSIVTGNLLGLGFDIPRNHPIITGPIKLNGLEQYRAYPINIATYSSTGQLDMPLAINVDDKLATTLATNNNQIVTWSYQPEDAGEHILSFSISGYSVQATASVSPTTTSLTNIENDLVLDLVAKGHSNSELGHNTWTYGNISTSFSGFTWDHLSGWDGTSLVVAPGTKATTTWQPFAKDVASTGFTLEMGFSSEHVLDEALPFIDLTTEAGVGLLMSPSITQVQGSNGTKLSVRHRAGDRLRVALVVNPRTGPDKNLVMLYIDGILSGTVPLASAENLICPKSLAIGSEKNTIKIQHIRAYSRALSSSEVINNYALYQPSVEDIMSIYTQNDILNSLGRITPESLMGQLPVMLVTGPVHELENTTDKNYTIYVDIQYTNLQDPTKSFTTKGTRMRPQGTSSMSYPKKNFRIYTNYGEMLDYTGKPIEGGNYTFVSGAQPVSCWCLKADYAESSSTHNTGVARLWNHVMYNARLGNEYVLRTEAQKAALANNFNKDVRTTVDGFPIAMFYRLTPESEIIFIGKYNFNNDKSTESVFGFKGIPGFDNSKMQCWEILNNGNPLALFTTMEGFDTGWKEAYESRYPAKSKEVGDLKILSEWLVSTRPQLANPGTNLTIHSEVASTPYNGSVEYMADGSYPDTAENRLLKFIKEKWDHLDVYKVAAYYIYLMRFGAVDQTVKNAMLTTEGTQGHGTKCKWFFINYDNDTIFGVRNDGKLVYPYNINRQTLDQEFSTPTYAYAGHESTLWNNLEADPEFMTIVKDIDEALYQAGLSYGQLLHMFDNEQSAKWCHRVYNTDAEYKYLGPWRAGVNNLFMLQGSRTSHRRYWLSKRFDILDSINTTGKYRAKVFEIKVGAAPSGVNFTVTSGNSDIYFGYGVNNIVKAKVPNPVPFGDSVTFTTNMALNIGDPLRIYAGPNVLGIDIHEFTPYLVQLNMAGVWDEVVGSKLRDLVLGVDAPEYSQPLGNINTSLVDLSGIKNAKYLEKIHIQGYKGLTSLDLSSNYILKELKAKGSGLRSLKLPDSTIITTLVLPQTLESLIINGASRLKLQGLVLEGNGSNLKVISLLDMAQFDSFEFVKRWMVAHGSQGYVNNQLTITNLRWNNISAEDLLAIGRLQDQGLTLRLTGKAHITNTTQSIVEELKRLFGNNCFLPSSEFSITAPDAVYLVGPSTIKRGSNVQYTAAVFSQNYGTVTYMLVHQGVPYIDKVVKGCIINSKTGYLTTVEDDNSGLQLQVAAIHQPTQGTSVKASMDLQVVPITYPNAGTIDITPSLVHEVGQVTANLVLQPANPDGLYKVEWSISTTSDIATISGNTATATIELLQAPDPSNSVITVTAIVKKQNNGQLLLTATGSFEYAPVGVIMTSVTNPVVMDICHKAGWAANAKYMTAQEASLVLDLGGHFRSKLLPKGFPEFEHFTNIVSTTNNNIPFLGTTLDGPLKLCGSVASQPGILDNIRLTPKSRFILTDGPTATKKTLSIGINSYCPSDYDFTLEEYKALLSNLFEFHHDLVNQGVYADGPNGLMRLDRFFSSVALGKWANAPESEYMTVQVDLGTDHKWYPRQIPGGPIRLQLVQGGYQERFSIPLGSYAIIDIGTCDNITAYYDSSTAYSIQIRSIKGQGQAIRPHLPTIGLSDYLGPNRLYLKGTVTLDNVLYQAGFAGYVTDINLVNGAKWSPITLGGLVQNCSVLESLPPLDIKPGLTWQAAFEGCTALDPATLPAEVNQPLNMHKTFMGCKRLKRFIPIIPNPSLVGGLNLTRCYYGTGIEELHEGILSGVEVSNLSYMFTSCTGLIKASEKWYSGIKLSPNFSSHGLFGSCTKLTGKVYFLPTSDYGISDTSGTFYGCTSSGLSPVLAPLSMPSGCCIGPLGLDYTTTNKTLDMNPIFKEFFEEASVVDGEVYLRTYKLLYAQNGNTLNKVIFPDAQLYNLRPGITHSASFCLMLGNYKSNTKVTLEGLEESSSFSTFLKIKADQVDPGASYQTFLPCNYTGVPLSGTLYRLKGHFDTCTFASNPLESITFLSWPSFLKTKGVNTYRFWMSNVRYIHSIDFSRCTISNISVPNEHQFGSGPTNYTGFESPALLKTLRWPKQPGGQLYPVPDWFDTLIDPNKCNFTVV